VFHVHALYYTKTLITNKCTKRVLSSIVTHFCVFQPCWVIFRENFFGIVTLGLHSLRSQPALQCRLGPQRVHASSTQSTAHSHSTIKCNPRLLGPQRVHASSTQSTAHSHSTIKCNPSVITKKFSLKMTQQGRNM
jgi:hypothetical protein